MINFSEILGRFGRRSTMVKWCLAIGLMVLSGLNAAAAVATTTTVTLRLSADRVRSGETVWAGIHIELAEGWHTYWRYGGESAQPPEIAWRLPDGVKAGDIQWPVPEKFKQADIFSYGYHHDVMLLVPLAVNAGVGELVLEADVRWLECKELCVPRNVSLTASLEVGEASQRSADADLINGWRGKVPRVDLDLPLVARWDVEENEDERSFMVYPRGEIGGILRDFYPHAFDDFEVTGQTDAVSSGEALAGIRKSIFKYDGSWPIEMAGLVAIELQRGGGIELTETVLKFGDQPEENAPGAASGSPAGGTSNLESASPGAVQMLFFAFLGGLILNFMPCVLPVIALKILGFVKQSQESPGRVKQLGLLYAVGVLTSFLILAGLVIGVQQAGRLASWGMQFQNLQFLVLMMVLVTLVSLNFFGVFEINLGGRAMGAVGQFSGKEGNLGAFSNGVLATILATPCTAPFLAPALGFAFAQPPAWIVLFFVTIALGLAFPYVVLSWNPNLLGYLPKPGPWMARFKTAMGFPMLATAVWLYSVALSHFADGAELWLGLMLVFVALSAWIWGQFVQQVSVRKPLSIGLAALVGVGGCLWVLEGELHWRETVPVAQASGGSVVEKGIEWRSWTHAAVAEARAAGHPVLVDFTAKWCQNCQANKRFSIEIDTVREKLTEIDGVTFRADFTHYDPTIAQELEKFDRAGVPLVLVYSGADPTARPQVLPPLLTPGIVLDALEQATN